MDQASKVELRRLNYIKENQDNLRSEILRGIYDAVTEEDQDATRVDRRTFLPSSVTGSPRTMCQHYQDAMAIVNSLGSPTYFVTFTTNPE